MLGTEQGTDAFLFDVRVLFLEVRGKVKSDNGEAGVVVRAGFVIAMGWGLKLLRVSEYVLAFGSVDVADAGVPACRLKGLAQETGVRPCSGMSVLVA